MHTSTPRLVRAAIAAFVLACAQAYAGPLRDFERDVTHDGSSKGSSSSSDHDRDHGPDPQYYAAPDQCGASDPWCDQWLGIIPAILIGGGACSWLRVHPQADVNTAEIEPRKPGEPVIPFLRLDGAYVGVDQTIDALDGRVQVGYGPAAVDYGLTRFKEDPSGDRLDLQKICGLYRMSFGSHVEVDLGMGGVTLKGAARTSEVVYTVPVLVYPADWWGVEFRPAWARFEGATLQDYDLGLYLNWKGASLKVGYRWLLGRAQELSGAYVGVVYRY
jgi:hypothetical protein